MRILTCESDQDNQTMMEVMETSEELDDAKTQEEASELKALNWLPAVICCQWLDICVQICPAFLSNDVTLQLPNLGDVGTVLMAFPG